MNQNQQNGDERISDKTIDDCFRDVGVISKMILNVSRTARN